VGTGKPVRYYGYYVYENRQQRRSRIHDADCGHCQHGQGKHGLGSATVAGRWHGPFETFVDAQQAAARLGHQDTRACSRCVDS
jgi:F-type H+-transporting ATPase subunit beta